MNIPMILIMLILFLGILYISIEEKNIVLAIVSGILAMLLGSLFFFSGGEVITEKCSFEIVNSTTIGNVTTNQLDSFCNNQTVVPINTGESLILNSLGIIFVILGIGIILGKVVGEHE